MADIDPKAQALSAAMRRITELQQQMTDKVLQVASEIEKLTDVVPAPEAKAFLKTRCNLPASELSTYLGFAKTLRGSEEVLRKTRASFPVVRLSSRRMPRPGGKSSSGWKSAPGSIRRTSPSLGDG